MKVKITKKIIYKLLIVVAIFWLSDLVLHQIGVGETNYYYTIKLINSVLFAFIWFGIFDSSKFYKRIVYSFIFGTWVSFSYLISSYSGLVQFFGITAAYGPPPFVIFGIYLSPFLWWVSHSLTFLIGLEVARLIDGNNF